MTRHELEKYGLALNQILINISGISSPDLSEAQEENLAVRDSLIHRARSINHHLNLLEAMSRHSEDQQALNHPRAMFDFVTQIYSIQFPAEVFFEDMLFNFGSYYDYLAKMMLLFFKNRHDRMDWRNLIKELNKKEAKKISFFDQAEIQKSTIAGILKLNRERIRPLYDYRSDLIHNRTDRTSGKKNSTYVQGRTPSLESEIIIGMPENFSSIVAKLVEFKIKAKNASPDIFETSRALSVYFWNTNIHIMNLLIAENNARHKVQIQKLSPIVDGV